MQHRLQCWVFSFEVKFSDRLHSKYIVISLFIVNCERCHSKLKYSQRYAVVILITKSSFVRVRFEITVQCTRPDGGLFKDVQFTTTNHNTNPYPNPNPMADPKLNSNPNAGRVHTDSHVYRQFYYSAPFLSCYVLCLQSFLTLLCVCVWSQVV